MVDQVRVLRALYVCLGFSISFINLAVRRTFGEFNTPLAHITLYLGIVYSVWSVKFLLAFLTDTVTFRGTPRRRPFIMLGSFLSAFFWMLVASLPLDVGSFVVLLTLAQVSQVLMDVALDALLVETVQRVETGGDDGKLQAQTWYGRALGGCFGVLLGGVIVQEGSPAMVYGLQAGMHFFNFVIAWVLLREGGSRSAVPVVPLSPAPEDPGGEAARDRPPSPRLFVIEEVEDLDLGLEAIELENDDDGGPEYPPPPSVVWHKLTTVLSNLANPISARLLLYVFLTTIPPSAGLPVFYYLRDELYFSDVKLGAIAASAQLAKLLATILFRGWDGVWAFSGLRTYRLRGYYFATGLVDVFISILPIVLVLGLVENPVLMTIFAMSDDVFSELIRELMMAPLLVLAAKLCRKGVESTFYSSVLALINSADMFGTLISAGTTHAFAVNHDQYDNLPRLILFCGGLQLLVVVPASMFLWDKTIPELLLNGRTARRTLAVGARKEEPSGEGWTSTI